MGTPTLRLSSVAVPVFLMVKCLVSVVGFLSRLTL